MTMNPPPPMFPATGWTTASANPTATAASTALPPRRRISLPTSLASGCDDTTMACGAATAWARPASAQSAAMIAWWAGAVVMGPGPGPVLVVDGAGGRGTRGLPGAGSG